VHAFQWSLCCLVALAVIARNGACQGPPSRPAGADTVRWAIVGVVEVAPEGCCNSLRAFRIAVSTPSHVDTLPVLTLEPDQMGEGWLFLRVVSGHADISLARYQVSTRILDSIAVPDDYDRQVTSPAFYGPRKLLAYGVDTAEESRVVVRRWPGWRLVASGPAVQHCNEVPLGVEWTAAGRYVRFMFCKGDTPASDSLKVPAR